MSRTARNFVFGSLLSLVAVLIGLFTALLIWGGRIEATLLVFGNPVFVAIDARNPRVLLMLTLPIFLIWTAIRVHSDRNRHEMCVAHASSGEPDEPPDDAAPGVRR